MNLEMFEFVGALVGMAFRSGSVLEMKLTSFFYKWLTGELVESNDLEQVDQYAIQAMNDLVKARDTYGRETFGEYMDQRWTTTMSNGETVELKPNGKDLIVDFDSVNEYNKLCLETRCKESQKQMQAVIRGFNYIFPASILTILTPEEVEYRVVGPTTIDIEFLKKMT
jgi:hypothetical protein